MSDAELGLRVTVLVAALRLRGLARAWTRSLATAKGLVLGLLVLVQAGFLIAAGLLAPTASWDRFGSEVLAAAGGALLALGAALAVLDAVRGAAVTPSRADVHLLLASPAPAWTVALLHVGLRLLAWLPLLVLWSVLARAPGVGVLVAAANLALVLAGFALLAVVLQAALCTLSPSPRTALAALVLALGVGAPVVACLAAFARGPGTTLLGSLACLAPIGACALGPTLGLPALPSLAVLAALDLALVAVMLAVADGLREEAAGARDAGRRSSASRHVTLPPLPWLGGAGPWAWRECLALVRVPGKLAGLLAVTVALAMLASQAPVSLRAAGLLPPGAEMPRGAVAVLMLLVAALFGSVLLESRTHLAAQGRSWLRSLPLHGLPFVLGQVVPRALAVFTVQVLACAWWPISLEGAERALALRILALALPLDATLLAASTVAAAWLATEAGAEDAVLAQVAMRSVALRGSVAGATMMLALAMAAGAGALGAIATGTAGGGWAFAALQLAGLAALASAVAGRLALAR